MSLPGRIIYHLWHRPIAAVHRSRRHGGPLVQWRAARDRSAMQAAVSRLPLPSPRPAGSQDFAVHFLTGKRFAYQTAFCLHSLARHSSGAIAPEFYDDGTLDEAAREPLLRLFPTARVHNHSELRARLDQFLPVTRFPVLRERRENYPHIRKLIDVHLGRAGWRLVLDSDLLFWREPRFLLDWAAAPDRPLHATDCVENYGYDRSLLERIAGAPIPPLVNVGICGLRSDAVDWDFLEHASATLLREVGTSYYLEQGLVALLAARQPGGCAVAPAKDYVTLPSPDEIVAPSAVMHHYVDTSRDGYHTLAWRRTLDCQ